MFLEFRKKNKSFKLFMDIFFFKINFSHLCYNTNKKKTNKESPIIKKRI